MAGDQEYNLSLLASLLPPPGSSRSAPSTEQLNECESALGISFPDDYRAVTTTYGAGWIDDFVELISIVKEKTRPCFQEELKSSRVELGHFDDDDDSDFAIWPSEGCLIPWARSANGDWLLSDQPGTTVIAIDSKGRDVESYDEGIVQFLCKFLSRERQIGIFPDDAVLEDSPHVFSVNFGTTLGDQ